ncbi:MAG: hypothetical protein M0Z77_10715 [Thermoplasmatales archaeon]|jgi:hypothetical protein|nr:hypothetical protein [Candidatus Thermoplasmatota archaeon]MDA8056098.1 hypothetical protein [Thermoplasmatales archaeon]
MITDSRKAPIYLYSVLLTSVLVYAAILVNQLFYVGGLPLSYYVFQVFLDTLVLLLFAPPVAFWYYGGKSNPYWLFLLFLPQLSFMYLGFPLYTFYLIPFIPQIPLLRWMIKRYHIANEKFRENHLRGR